MTTVDDALARELIDCVGRSVDINRLKRELNLRLQDQHPPAAAGTGGGLPEGGTVASRVLGMLALDDVLDSSILGARPGHPSFALRVFFGELSNHADEETAFALGCGLNFFFRVPMDEENKTRLGLEVSRMYYHFAEEVEMDPEQIRQLSPLLARLLSTELERVALESVDHFSVFDSGIHERSQSSDATSSAISTPLGFLCRVVANGRVRNKAIVRT